MGELRRVEDEEYEPDYEGSATPGICLQCRESVDWEDMEFHWLERHTVGGLP